MDNEGSSNQLCNEDYRGISAFSEEETKAIKAFLEAHNEIKIAINYHSFGNLLIMPFNYISDNSNMEYLKQNLPKEYDIYMDIIKNGNFPNKFLYGNGVSTIG